MSRSPTLFLPLFSLVHFLPRVHRGKHNGLLYVLLVALFVGGDSSVFAQGSTIRPLVTVGKSATFTTFNYFNSWNEIMPPVPTPDNPNSDGLALEPVWEEQFDGKTARIGVVADPGHQGVKEADAGLSLRGIQASSLYSKLLTSR